MNGSPNEECECVGNRPWGGVGLVGIRAGVKRVGGFQICFVTIWPQQQLLSRAGENGPALMPHGINERSVSTVGLETPLSP